MAEDIIRASGNKLGFGDYTLEVKAKQSGFEFCGGLYKVKTCREITKLERNELFVYESVPGTKVSDFEMQDTSACFTVSGFSDTQVTLEMEEEEEYEVFIDGISTGTMKTNLGGKLILSVDLSEGDKKIHIRKTRP